MIAGLHIELTNKCTLKCARCARTTFIDQFGTSKWKNSDISLDALQKFIDIDLHSVTVSLCGNYGDPIYHNEFVNIIQWFKHKGANLLIFTNGSYKTINWWQEVAKVLTNNDTVLFAIDGVPENFTQYRVNADWDSIQQGIRVLADSDCRVIWKYIPFSFNEEDIDRARSIAQSLGMDNLVVDPSDRWDHNDQLTPKNFLGPSQWQKITWNIDKPQEVHPKCKNGDQHYISADGFYMPCCYVGDWRFYYKSEFYKNKERYNISNTTMTQLLSSEELKNFYNNITIKPESYCTFNCPK